MAKGTVPADVIGSILGGGTSIQPGRSWVYDIPAPSGTSGSSFGNPGNIKIFQNESVFVDQSYFGYITAALTANKYAASGLDNAKTMPSIQVTNEWMALVLAIIDEESQFGQTGLGDVFNPPGGYPNGDWVVNGDDGGGIGPMQISTKQDRVYPPESFNNAENNIHAGIHHLWWYGNTPDGKSNRGSGTGQPWGFVNDLEFTIRAYNCGPGGARGGGSKPYLSRVFEQRYPWYLQQLQSSSSSTSTSTDVIGKIASIIKEAVSYLGTPYEMGGVSHSKIDCSGLMMVCFRTVGINLPRTAKEQITVGQPINKIEDMVPGDRVYWAFGRLGSDADHTGLYIGDNRIIHAHGGGTHNTSYGTLTGDYKNNFIGGRRSAELGGDMSGVQAVVGGSTSGSSQVPLRSDQIGDPPIFARPLQGSRR